MNLGSGPENRTLPCTLIQGNYTLIRRARTPVLTTVEARLGIEPRLSALQADAFPLGYHALAGPGRLELPYAVLETAVLAAEQRPCKFVFQLSKSEKKARFLGRAFLESEMSLDSTRRLRSLDSSP